MKRGRKPNITALRYEHDGQNLTIREWSTNLNIGAQTLYKRLARGCTHAQAFTATKYAHRKP